MQTEPEWEAFDASAFETTRSMVQETRVEKMRYRTPGTTSVSANLVTVENSSVEHGASPGAAEFAAEISFLKLRIEQTEAAWKAEAEQALLGGLKQGREQAQEENRAARSTQASQIGSALESFQVEREKYFARVEQEVVRLALAIASRILHREALLDPLLLTGAVKVALGQLGETTSILLRTPAGQADEWRTLLGLMPRGVGAAMPEIVEDPLLGAGDCMLETRVGSVDLGVKAQLAEIERGFFDLLEQRPAPVMGRRL